MRNLYSKFQQSAEQVVDLALAGKKREAQQLMSLEVEYTKVTFKLTAPMSDWVKSMAVSLSGPLRQSAPAASADSPHRL